LQMGRTEASPNPTDPSKGHQRWSGQLLESKGPKGTNLCLMGFESGDLLGSVALFTSG
jgi:hypothetical protein